MQGSRGERQAAQNIADRAGQSKGRNARARGGRMSGVRLPGVGRQDTVPMADGGYGAPGEPVLTRHQEAVADSMLGRFGTSIDRIMATVRTRHSQSGPGSGRAGNRMVGGRVATPATVGLRGAKAGLTGYARLGQQHGLVVTSGLRPGSITSSGNVSLHASGDAIDLAGSASGMLAFTKAIAARFGRGLDELIYSPWGRSIKNGRVVRPYAVADHFDHVHVGDRTPGGGALGAAAALGAGLLAQAINLRAPRSRQRGVPGALANRAMGGMTVGLERAVNDRLAVMGGGLGGGLSGFSGGGSAGANRALGQRMVTAAFGAGQWPAFDQLIQRESAWNHLARNPTSGAYGLGQSLPAGKMASAGPDWQTNPATQLRWTLDYIRGRYRTPSAALAWHNSHNWYARGGRLPAFDGWFARGGQGVYSSPTLIGVGDRQPTGGRERVQVTRERPGTQTRRNDGVVLNLGGVHVHVTGGSTRDIERAAERAAAIVATRTAAELERLGVEAKVS